MSEVTRIHDQMSRAFAGDAWHGPALREVLKSVNAKQAAEHPIATGHSIWEIVNHLAAWLTAIRARGEGKVAELDGTDDWPPVRDSSEAAWHVALASLEQRHRELLSFVERLDDDRLSDPVPNRDYDLCFLLHGAIQHNLYHAGQIVMLKKALTTR